MLKRALDAVMERRARRLREQVDGWLPAAGPVLDLGSGTGHLAVELERALGVRVVTADVTDIHVVGPPPVPVADGVVPFPAGSFSAALLAFVLAYPREPAAVLAEAARVARESVILVQTVYAGPIGRAWHRGRELFWTVVAFHASRLVGYVPREARFTMRTRRYFTAHALGEEVRAAGLRVRARRERAVLPGGALVVVAWLLERDA